VEHIDSFGMILSINLSHDEMNGVLHDEFWRLGGRPETLERNGHSVLVAQQADDHPTVVPSCNPVVAISTNRVVVLACAHDAASSSPK
jgi:hypothetical protein